MGADEGGTTLRQLKAHRRALVDPRIAQHRGRIVKTTGDGMLVEFVSVVDAVRCSVEIQHGMAERNVNVPKPSPNYLHPSTVCPKRKPGTPTGRAADLSCLALEAFAGR
jgi:class 3 adenylate cyclase